MSLPDGDLLDIGWLTGPASAVVMTQGTTAVSAAIARWAPDPRTVAFWIRRHGRPLTAQDTTLTPFTRSMLERRAENAVRFRLASARAAARWLETIERLATERRFVMTLNFYGAAGIKPVTPGGPR